jgi:DNA phosphorothioation-dependent restriction protein DptF
MIRCFYLLMHVVLENNYHYKFEGSFNEQALTLYKKMWAEHKNFDGSNEQKALLKPFYNDVVLASINKYANRNAPYLSKDEFYISSRGDCDLSAEVDLSISYSLIEKDDFHHISEFNLHIRVNDDELRPIPVNVNLLAMMMDIVDGFRPNKHDKNSVVLLDELVNKITEMANQSKVLFLYTKNKERLKLKKNPDGDIRVSGL